MELTLDMIDEAIDAIETGKSNREAGFDVNEVVLRSLYYAKKQMLNYEEINKIGDKVFKMIEESNL